MKLRAPIPAMLVALRSRHEASSEDVDKNHVSQFYFSKHITIYISTLY